MFHENHKIAFTVFTGKGFRAVFHALLLILNICLLQQTSAQNTSRVSIDHADHAYYINIASQKGKSIQKLIGNVHLHQDSTNFYCDSAYLDDQNNNFEAFANVHINYNDSVNIYGDYLFYDRLTRIAKLDSNVRMVDKRATLYSDHLFYNRNTNMAYYNQGGRIVDKDNVLTSKTGKYFTDANEFFFKDSVVVVNPDYTMYSDTMKYNTLSEVVYISGPTRIIGKEDRIYSEDGWYDTRNDLAHLYKNNLIIHNEEFLRGDTIYYDKNNGYGKAMHNVSLKDTVQNILMLGKLAEVFRKTHYSYITGRAQAILIDSEDSLYMHADTFKVVSDTNNQLRNIFAYNHMKFFRKNLQGASDSMVYYVPDSVITMYKEPILWSDENQLTADSIRIFVSNNRVDSLILDNSAFIISEDSLKTYNQIKGKQMRGYFRKNELYKINVLGNSETIYFVRDEKGFLIGINKALASDMSILLNNRQIKDILYFTKPDATLYPEKEISPDELKLKGFRWVTEKRPMNRNDIFNW